jgi:hypothetical protein
MPTSTSNSPAALPVPVAMSGALGAAAMSVLPLGATFAAPHLQSANDSANVLIVATAK